MRLIRGLVFINLLYNKKRPVMGLFLFSEKPCIVGFIKIKLWLYQSE